VRHGRRFGWRTEDPDRLERYVYPNAIGSGDGDDWRLDPLLNEVAEEVTRNASTREEAFRALAEYVSRNVENPAGRTFSRVVPPTKQCREIRSLGRTQGDCTEAALLLVAMSRSVGIPARYVMDGGIEPYGGDDSPGLAGHAWAEAYLDGEWVMADASPKSSDCELIYDDPRTFVGDKMVTVPAAYVPSGRDYLYDAHLRDGWVNDEVLAERYLSGRGYLVLPLDGSEKYTST